MARKEQPRAPLIPLPILPEPFTRVAINIIGPLTRTESGNRYILTMIDYASRYLDAVTLRSTNSKTVTEALLIMFSRLEVPTEVLTDHRSNFLSSMMEHL